MAASSFFDSCGILFMHSSGLLSWIHVRNASHPASLGVVVVGWWSMWLWSPEVVVVAVVVVAARVGWIKLTSGRSSRPTCRRPPGLVLTRGQRAGGRGQGMWGAWDTCVGWVRAGRVGGETRERFITLGYWRGLNHWGLADLLADTTR